MKIEINPASWKTKPFAHQVVGVKFLLANPRAALLDEMGSGKSLQFVVSASLLWEIRAIDTVLVICPAAVKSTWGGREGQIRQHVMGEYSIQEYGGLSTRLRFGSSVNNWVIASYEFVRIPSNLAGLLTQLRGRKTMVIFDESSYIKSHQAAQTKASVHIAKMCVRAYIANGSPINNSLIDLYPQLGVIDKKIIGSPNYWAFRGRYCQMGGYQNKNIVGYVNVEELQKKIAPYVLRRLKEDCLDLPPKLYNTAEVPFLPKTWQIYKELRNDLIAWIDKQTPIVTLTAIVKIIRLSQLTSGMAGGLNRSRELAAGLLPDLPFDELQEEPLEQVLNQEDIKVISEEKHQWVVNWVNRQVAEDPTFKVILWSRFRKEQELLRDMLLGYVKPQNIMRIYGGQNKLERESVIEQFNTPSPDAGVLLSQPRAGGLGLNLQMDCNWAVYVSNDYSLLTRQQSEDRIHRPGQKRSTVNYLDVLVTGPSGQKTIDHQIKKTLMAKDDLATRTLAYWRAAILEE